MRAGHVGCNKRCHGMAQISKCCTCQSEMSTPQFICELQQSSLRNPSHVAFATLTDFADELCNPLPSSFIQHCRGNRWRLRENRTNRQGVLSVHLSGSEISLDFPTISKIAANVPFQWKHIYSTIGPIVKFAKYRFYDSFLRQTVMETQ